jgi:hypothetical protein
VGVFFERALRERLNGSTITVSVFRLFFLFVSASLIPLDPPGLRSEDLDCETGTSLTLFWAETLISSMMEDAPAAELSDGTRDVDPLVAE